MKTTLFTLIVLAASGYLAYSQIHAVQQMIDRGISNFDAQAAPADRLEDKITALEAEVSRLKDQPLAAIPAPIELDDFIAEVPYLAPEETPETTMSIKERSDALLELAERMELKAIAQ